MLGKTLRREQGHPLAPAVVSTMVVVATVVVAAVVGAVVAAVVGAPVVGAAVGLVVGLTVVGLTVVAGVVDPTDGTVLVAMTVSVDVVSLGAVTDSPVIVDTATAISVGL